MAKDKPPAEQREQIEAQRRKAQAALDRNRVSLGRGEYRALTRRERAAYERVVERTDKLLGPVSKPRRRDGAKQLASGLRTLKAFAERVRAGKEQLGELPEKTEKK